MWIFIIRLTKLFRHNYLHSIIHSSCLEIVTYSLILILEQQVSYNLKGTFDKQLLQFSREEENLFHQFYSQLQTRGNPDALLGAEMLGIKR